VKNPCNKIVTPETAYEVWQSHDGQYTTFVLKKYKNPEAEEKDPFARWYVCTKSAQTPHGEYGDTYAAEVKRTSHRIENPLAQKDVPTTEQVDIGFGEDGPRYSHENGHFVDNY